ncbi:hypothetical protein HBA_0422 [Sodalis endosymbiont of Henestaris halophilus]|nr:hypothetical protein HBA_0422 [Sodalis endosymbiont of Henestaris halophilus]
MTNWLQPLKLVLKKKLDLRGVTGSDDLSSETVR